MWSAHSATVLPCRRTARGADAPYGTGAQTACISGRPQRSSFPASQSGGASTERSARMEERQSVLLDDLSEGAELDEEQLRAIVGSQRSCFDHDAEVCTCAAEGGYDCD